MSTPATYWEHRAHRFARDGDGLAAVCSYGMPGFYNRLIDWCQRLALRRWLGVPPGTRILDVGCGIGRWSRLLASRSAQVTGVDLSPTMIAQARRRAREEGLADRCRFEVQDISRPGIHELFDLVLGVTVLQHILDPDALQAALANLTRHLAPGGRLVLLEAAPTRRSRRCDTAIFRARGREEYLALFASQGLKLRALSGVDPAPFKIWLLPYLSRLPRPIARAGLAAVVALSAPIDLILGRIAVGPSWHAVFVLERPPGDPHAH